MASTTKTRPARDGWTEPPTGRIERFGVYRTAALVGLPLLALVLIWALLPRDYYTGTNSVRTRDFVQPVDAGQRLCVNGLAVPGGTGRVQVELVSLTGRPTAVRLQLASLPGRVQTAAARVPAGRSKVAFPIRARPNDAPPTAARACFRPTHEVNFGGTLNIGGAAPTLSGKPTASRIAVWYLPPSGTQRSFLAQLPDVLKRAALFRPGFVGPWTYLILLLLVPAAALLAVRLLHRATSSRE